jgi:hypothetical protein
MTYQRLFPKTPGRGLFAELLANQARQPSEQMIIFGTGVGAWAHTYAIAPSPPA